jgi:hypothetical protein
LPDHTENAVNGVTFYVICGGQHTGEAQVFESGGCLHIPHATPVNLPRNEREPEIQ